MGRPRKHESDAERRQAHAASQRAYRRRQAEDTVPVDRRALEELVAAIDGAAQAGDPVARRVRTGGADSLLRNLARHFRQVAEGLG